MKKLAVLSGACLLSLSVAGTVFASNDFAIKLNGIEFLAPSGSKIENGQFLVPIKWITEQLGSDVTWNEKNHEVELQVPEQKNLKAQIDSLTNAVITPDPKEAVNTWIKGVKTRSGALQYAIMSPELQQNTYNEFSQNFWVTGGSSPKMANEQLQDETLSDIKVKYTLTYDLKDSSGIVGKSNRTVTVEKDGNDHWFVTGITTTDKSDILTPGVKVINQLGAKETPSAFSEQEAGLLAGQAQQHFWYVNSGGSWKSDEKQSEGPIEEFPIAGKGDHYRWMGTDFGNKEQYISYMEEVYTPEKAQQFWNEQVDSGSIVDVNGRLAQPNADGGSILDWSKAKATLIEDRIDQKTYLFNVPIGDTGTRENHRMTVRYVEGKGWRLDESVRVVK
jgi:hypothetical protein